MIPRRLARRVVLSVTVAVGICTASAADMTKDQVFATLYAMNRHQIEVSDFAMENAERQGVQDLAQVLRQDHVGLNKWLKGAVAEAGISVPLNEITSEGYERLQTLDGPDFDREFLRYQQDLHDRTLQLLQQNRPPDAEMSAYANHLKITHEALRRHLALIQEEIASLQR